MGRPDGRLPGRTLTEFVDWLRAAPPMTSLDAQSVLTTLEAMSLPATPIAVQSSATSSAPTWRERIWTAPGETRLGAAEAAEALGRTKSFVYRHTGATCAVSDRLPHRKLDGELVFTVHELRTWLRQREESIVSTITLDRAS